MTTIYGCSISGSPSVLGVFHAVGLAVGDDDGGVVQAVEDADRGGLFG